uniref:Uncharacterized protein n=1 Tax=Peromyscus maniculatus bairdii TaxID=230844 RepID=A0A8C8UAM7_PERMB
MRRLILFFLAENIFRMDLGEKGRWIRELIAVVGKRFGFPESSVELYAEKVIMRGLCAIAQAVSVLQTLRRACCTKGEWGQGLQGCVSMKFVDGVMIHSGDPVNYYVDIAMYHALPRQGVLGIKVKTMLPWDLRNLYLTT